MSCRGLVRKLTVVRGGQRAGVARVTIMEPYRINAVEPIPLMTREEREAALVTITNNGGGQPVSMGNLAAVSRICQERRVALFLDAARFAENAWLVTQRALEVRDRSPREVAETAFRLANGCVASMKQEGLVDMGRFLALRDEELARCCQLLLVATEWFPTYGGMAGRDLDMLAQGLTEVTDLACLWARAGMARHLADLARAAGVEPPGIHAIHLTAGRLLAYLPAYRFPGPALACELCLQGGIRPAELGSLSLGEGDGDGEPLVAASYGLVRLAIPRRVDTQTHIEHVGRILARVAERISGYHIGAAAIPDEAGARADSPSRLVGRRLSGHPDEGVRNPMRRRRLFCPVPTGTPQGDAPKVASHHRFTPLHVGDSCYLVDRDGRLLIAQRARAKAAWASVRTNSCSGHPAPRNPCANPFAAMPAPRSVRMSRTRP